MTAALISPYRYLGRSADDWRQAGQAKLGAQRERVVRDMNYYLGNFPLTFIPAPARSIFTRLLAEARTNWCELVVNAVAERLQVVYFSFGDTATDELAWLLWRDNGMDADGEMAQQDALACGHSFVGVWPDPAKMSGVRIDIEHPSQVCAFYAPGTRRDPVAVYKSFGNPADQGRTDVLITPDRVETWVGDDVPVYEDNLLGVVPYVELVPSPTTLGPPRSELHAARTIQDRINTTIYNRLVATDFGAFRQITATGVPLPRDAAGQPRAPFDVGADRLLASENPDAAFGVIPESNLRGYLDAVQADVNHLAAITQTPPHYLLGQIVNASGDALKAAEAGLVAKVARRAAHFGEGWERVIRLALGFVGSLGAADVQADVVWRDFETRSEAQLVDALVKMAALGAPREYLWQRWGVSPQTIATWPSGPAPLATPGAAVSPLTQGSPAA